MLRMLEDLKDKLDDIEQHNEWEFNFVNSLIEFKEKFPSKKLSKNQFNILTHLHMKYCKNNMRSSDYG